ncbi:hypothetical protein EVAR_49683_1 [Eumeta japonica]|uniref:Uncharacterized protein n=1 Tax=Eumeta variegata TaxID=151549 RepID=A0A4C1WPS0_EUMVA|nr:hypothetical protein EVAR_49683_1 [Eumeta japonica]
MSYRYDDVARLKAPARPVAGSPGRRAGWIKASDHDCRAVLFQSSGLKLNRPRADGKPAEQVYAGPRIDEDPAAARSPQDMSDKITFDCGSVAGDGRSNQGDNNVRDIRLNVLSEARGEWFNFNTSRKVIGSFAHG